MSASNLYFSEEEIEQDPTLMPEAKVMTPEEHMIENLSAEVVDDLTLDSFRYGLEGMN